jgi:hypothetical protein
MMTLVTRECFIPAMNAGEAAGQPSGLPRTAIALIFSEADLPEFPVIPH